ncbi:MAG: sensor histidine kinase [Selenomonadaceae bacterium]|nr:sensor histidine kinase [Selenomonadaceae bacterium]
MYLRYLSFRDGMTDAERVLLWRRLLIWGIVSALIYGAMLKHFGISAPLYKFLLMVCWIPWQAIFMLTVRRNFLQHVFIMGMGSVWSLIQHNWAAIFCAISFNTELEILFGHAIFYLALFFLLLPVERRIFLKLLPPQNFFDSYGRFTSVFPLILISSVVIMWAQEPLVHSWAERFSRLYIPFVFFFFYRYVIDSTKQLYERRQTNQNLRRMSEQIMALGEYNRIMEESRDKIVAMRHDLRHSYRLIYMMLETGEIEEARRFIERQEKLIGTTKVTIFCVQPLINVALLIYVRRAENFGIKVQHKVNLPENIGVDESDLALLISNLLENAINASCRQPQNRRAISIQIQNVGEQFVVEIANLFDGEVEFDEKNMPRTSREGHGLGMVSVKNFADRYGAYVDFSKEGGTFKVTLYWLNLSQ